MVPEDGKRDIGRRRGARDEADVQGSLHLECCRTGSSRGSGFGYPSSSGRLPLAIQTPPEIFLRPP